MEKWRVTFKRDNGLPLSQRKDLDISSEVNRALFEAKVPHFVRIQGVTKTTRGCLSTITTPGATAEMLILYREIVIKAARKVDAGIVDIETNELWERVKMHGVNFDRYLGRHLTKDHKCNMVGCKANAGQNCTHNVDKCVNCKGNHIAKANCCVKKQEAIKMAREERRTWKEREGERRNVTTDQQKKPDDTEDGEPLTAEAEKKAQNDEQTEKEPEVQVVAAQETEGESSNAGTRETPVKSW